MHQSLQGATFHIEHIVPRSHDGESTLENLAWACPSCNLHNDNRVAVANPDTGEQVSLFHPRHDIWDEHFEWLGTELIGRSLVGWATIGALELNSERRRRIRAAEALFGLFPPLDH